MKPELGQRVRCAVRLVRKESYPTKSWIENTIPVEGLYIGKRSYQNGELDWLGPEEGHAWIQRGTIPVGLIVTSPNKNPIPVPFYKIEIEEVSE